MVVLLHEFFRPSAYAPGRVTAPLAGRGIRRGGDGLSLQGPPGRCTHTDAHPTPSAELFSCLRADSGSLFDSRTCAEGGWGV